MKTHSLALAVGLLSLATANAQAPTRTQRAAGGFLPGDYFNNCPDCGGRYLGHKHSQQCEVCGQKTADLAVHGNHYARTFADGAPAERIDPVLVVGADESMRERMHQEIVRYGVDQPFVFANPLDEELFGGGWPPNLFNDFPVVPVALPRPEDYGATWYNEGPQKTRNRWQARAGQWEKQLAKRRKANKAARRARKK